LVLRAYSYFSLSNEETARRAPVVIVVERFNIVKLPDPVAQSAELLVLNALPSEEGYFFFSCERMSFSRRLLFSSTDINCQVSLKPVQA